MKKNAKHGMSLHVATAPARCQGEGSRLGQNIAALSCIQVLCS